MVRNASFVISVTLLLAGCSFLPTNIVNEINMTQAVGYDLSKDQVIKGTIVYPLYKRDEPSETEVKTSYGETSKEIRINANNESRFPIVSGQMRLALYGKSLAEKGIFFIVDTLHRDPAIGTLVKMAVVDGDANELLTTKKYKQDNISLFTEELLDQNMKSGNLPKTDLETFLFQYYQKGQDPYLPLIKKDDGKVKVSGIAFFKDDKLVYQISEDEEFIFKCLVDRFRHGLHQFILEKGDKIVLDNLSSKPKVKVKIMNGVPEFTVQIHLKTRIQEFSANRGMTMKEKKQLERQVGSRIEKNASSMIKQFQKHKIDPLGLGARYKQHNRKFDEKRWKSLYPSSKVNVEVKVDIKQKGVIE